MLISLKSAGLMACTALAAVAQVAVSPHASDAGAAPSASRPAAGWTFLRPAQGPKSPQTNASARAIPAAIQPRTEPCPPGTTNYRGSAQPYSCTAVYLSGSNNQVGVRSGRSGSSGFGLLHALIDHNVESHTIGFIVSNSAGGVHQSGTRYIYAGTDHRINPAVTVTVIEDRSASSASPDSYFLGEVTAYCGNNGVCPEQVNQDTY